MQLKLLVATVVFGVATCYPTTDVPNQCPQPTASDPNPPAFLYGHPDDCGYYFTCSHGNPLLEPCSPGTRWSDFFQTCAGINSRYDTCTQNNAERECERGGLSLIPHPTKCQRYYNCSDPIRKESECPYPDLFDVEAKECRSFKQADCGPGRNPALDPCDYTIQNPSGGGGCSHAHCNPGPPCYVNWPSCVGLEDGFNVYYLREWSPYYVRCDTQRMVEKLYCGTHAASGYQGIFSPIKRECVSLWEVPRDHGGYQPSCEGKAPGQYRAENAPPHVYYSCPDGEVHFCQIGLYFKEDTQQCEATGP